MQQVSNPICEVPTSDLTVFSIKYDFISMLSDTRRCFLKLLSLLNMSDFTGKCSAVQTDLLGA